LEVYYAASRSSPVERVVESLAALLSVRRHPIMRQRVTFLDTFDGRVHRAGASLILTSDGAGRLLQWRKGELRLQCAVDKTAQFAWDLPKGAARQRIESVVEMRRLLPLAQSEHSGVLLDVLDQTRKTIARLSIISGRARSPKRRSPWRPLRTFLTVNALRGYDEQCRETVAIIDSRPGLERWESALQGHVLRAIGASAPHDQSRFNVALDLKVRADVGARRLHRELLRIMLVNHAGICADVDSEFLHEFRVALRRSRSLLAQLKAVLPQAQVDYFKSELSWLGQMTGSVRDLDVLLLSLRAPSNALDADQQRALIERLEHERGRAQQGLAAQLKGARYRELVRQWKQFLARRPGATPAEEHASASFATVVSQRARKLYRRTLVAIERVNGETTAHELHRIRIDAKKLRYLIDAAASFLDRDDLAVALRALKQLQAVLGDFHDACVQASWLDRYAGSLNETTPAAVMARQAAQALAVAASRRAAQLRKPVNRQLMRFGESSARSAFERLFRTEPHILTAQ
jgi:CHAD domain-containing protein